MPLNEANLDCMTFIAGRAASKTGYVLVGHNEDDNVFVRARHMYVPHARWPEGTLLPAEEGCAKVPQVAETFGYYQTRFLGPDGGLNAGDLFINENGVCIVTNSSSGSREDKDPENGICYELRRIIAERAKSAKHGLEVALDMLKTYGYKSPGRIYTIADSTEAFMIQVARGHRFLAARVPDDAVVVMPNHYTFHTLTDVPEMYYPDDLIQYSIERGWYTPETPGDYSDFDFAIAYQNPERYLFPGNMFRQKYGTRFIKPDFNPDDEGYPFCVKPAEPVSAEDFMRALSTHYEGTADDTRCGNGSSPHYTDIRRICTGSTLESAVFELNPNPLLTTMWTSYGRPCELPYIPVHPLCGAPATIDAVGDPVQEAENHHSPAPWLLTYSDCGWQRMKDFENMLEQVYSREIAGITSLKRSLHEEFRFQNDGNVLYASSLSAADAEEFLHSMDEKCAKYTLSTLDAVAKKLFTDVNVMPARIKRGESRFNLSFRADFEIDASTLIIRIGRSPYATGTAAVVPDSFSGTGNCFNCDFEFPAPPRELDYPGEYEIFLSGKKAADGTPFVGIAKLVSE